MQPFNKAKNKLMLNNTKERERKGIKEEKNKEKKTRKRNIDRGGTSNEKDRIMKAVMNKEKKRNHITKAR